MVSLAMDQRREEVLANETAPIHLVPVIWKHPYMPEKSAFRGLLPGVPFGMLKLL
jgi:hypothetical protein